MMLTAVDRVFAKILTSTGDWSATPQRRWPPDQLIGLAEQVAGSELLSATLMKISILSRLSTVELIGTFRRTFCSWQHSSLSVHLFLWWPYRWRPLCYSY